MSVAPQLYRSLIESWFQAHDDGEFCILPPEHGSFRSGDSAEAKTILYTTKPHCAARILEWESFEGPIAVIGRGGLPTMEDVSFAWGNKEAQRWFVGDADPPDLLTFAWLRTHFTVGWFGVRDELLGRRGMEVDRRIWTPLAESEKAALSLLSTVCVDYRDLMGGYCASLWESGFKCELEGALAQAG